MKAFLQALIEVGICATILLGGYMATKCYPQGLEYSSADERLICALDQHDERAVNVALSEGASPAACDPDGATALMHAAIMDDIKAVKALLARGAAVNAADRFGDDALIYAVRAQRKEIIPILLACGANPHHRNVAGNNAIDVARSWEAGDIVAMLVKYT